MHSVISGISGISGIPGGKTQIDSKLDEQNYELPPEDNEEEIDYEGWLRVQLVLWWIVI